MSKIDELNHEFNHLKQKEEADKKREFLNSKTKEELVEILLDLVKLPKEESKNSTVIYINQTPVQIYPVRYWNEVYCQGDSILPEYLPSSLSPIYSLSST